MICSTISANSIFLAMMIIPLITLPKASCVLLLPPPRIAIQNPKDYEARSNLMWTATWALNTLIGMGKTQDWMVHMLGQAVGAYTDATHGMTLSAVSLAYYRFLLPYGLSKFKRFAVNVWQICPDASRMKPLPKRGLPLWRRG